MQSKIEQQVMASVATVYTARQLVSSTALKLYVCALSLYGLVQLVWVHRVFDNMARVGLDGLGTFALSAVTHTSTLVQLTLAVFVVAGVSLFLDFVRSAGRSGGFAGGAIS
ncbi:hypothetical protein EXS62_00705 [Candidatus Kaiserbacteria bacterium]|nr:hypothetical protein [Candidatus Kaiserbacteria bacterium]